MPKQPVATESCSKEENDSVMGALELGEGLFDVEAWDVRRLWS